MSEWINVRDELPPFVKQNNYPTEPMCEWTELVLTYDDGVYNIDRCFKIGNIPEFFIKYCTHWMPLPQPPKEN
jgi:hypothetical protein